MRDCYCSHKYVDADGDIAHEFYEQQRIMYKTPNGKRRKSKMIMRKIPTNELTPLVIVNSNTPLIILLILITN